MLAQIGPAQFTVAPLNFNEAGHEAGSSFASHDVLGAHPQLEFVGEAQESWTLRGKAFPGRDAGALSAIGSLVSMAKSGQPYFFMRGDGVPMGWVVVEKITEKADYIDSHGVGRVIEFDVTIKRATAPGAAGAFISLVGLLS